MSMFNYLILNATLLGVCGLIYLYLCRAENKDYQCWLDGYYQAETIIESAKSRGEVIADWWNVQKDNDLSVEFKKGYKECLLDKGYLR